MPKPQAEPPPSNPLGNGGFWVSIAAQGHAWVMWPFLNFPGGKDFWDFRTAAAGAVTIMAWTLFLPGHTHVFTQFFVAWMVAVAIHYLLARFNHYFGRRLISNYVGFPIIAVLVPFGEQFGRRVLNPMMTLAASHYLAPPGLSRMLMYSAFGQLLVCWFMARAREAEDTGRSDMELLSRR